MNLPFFLYRRLAPVITCTLRFADEAGSLRLNSKYQVASFQDVFCSPFYWQALAHVRSAPRLVVDCGANCGHFSVLTELAMRARFPEARTRYVLVEPNSSLHAAIRQNAIDTGLAERLEIVPGLIGQREGTGTLWVDQRNFLTASTNRPIGHPVRVPFVHISNVIKGAEVDVLKLDVEGSEFEFVRENEDVLSRVALLIVEIHREQGSYDEFSALLASSGLKPAGEPVVANGQILASYAARG